MPTITEQIALERNMIARGQTKYLTSEKAALEGGREAETSYARTLTKSLLPDLADDIAEHCSVTGAARAGKYRKMLSALDPEKAAYFGLKGVFSTVFNDKPMVTTARTIGRMVEDELKFTAFQDEHENYYAAIIEDFKRKNTEQYRHKKRVLTHKMNEKEVTWEGWTPIELIQVGNVILDRILTTTDLIEKEKRIERGKTTAYVRLTKEAQEWIEKHKEYMSLLFPECRPTVIEPDTWTSYDDGGYYTPTMRQRVPLVKTRSRKQVDILRRTDLTYFLDAVNHLQRTQWRVNTKVHDVIKEVWSKGLMIGMGSNEPIEIPKSPFPGRDTKTFTEDETAVFMEWKREASLLHTAEKERVSKNFQTLRVMRLANEYRQYDKFWYVYQADFRGRLYSTTASFSPQGPDIGKAVIEFAQGQTLGERGMYWLCVHYANLCGYDKVSYDDRAQYTHDRERDIRLCAADPLGKFRYLWVDADKPYQALAAVFELAAAYEYGPGNVETHIPVALDGTCNGLQHFAAILRDERGAAATNVTDAGTVSDIYSEVGKVATRLLGSVDDDNPYRDKWAAYALERSGLPRKLAKKPVMTLPYGATRRTCTEAILDFLISEEPDLFPKMERFRAAMYLTPILWDAIKEVVVSARTAMDWLQDCGGLMAKQNTPLIWTSPIGFPVVQATKKITVTKIHTHLAGECRMNVGQQTDKLDSRKQRSGISPNFVHSMDASHLCDTLLRCKIDGINSFASIHDSFGTHAGQVDKLHRAIREAFSTMYHDFDALDYFRSEQETSGIILPAPPTMSGLDVRKVESSPYFFG